MHFVDCGAAYADLKRVAKTDQYLMIAMVFLFWSLLGPILTLWMPAFGYPLWLVAIVLCGMSFNTQGRWLIASTFVTVSIFTIVAYLWAPSLLLFIFSLLCSLCLLAALWLSMTNGMDSLHPRFSLIPSIGAFLRQGFGFYCFGILGLAGVLSILIFYPQMPLAFIEGFTRNGRVFVFWILLFPAIGLVLWAARHWRVAAPGEVLIQDTLLLRSFSQDQLKLPPAIHFPGFWNFLLKVYPAIPVFSGFREIELSLVAAHRPFGRVIAFAKPGEKVPPLGAQRIAMSETEWRERIQRMIGSNRLLIVLLGFSKSVQWELAEIARVRSSSPTMFLVPPCENGSALATAVEPLDKYFGVGFKNLPRDTLDKMARSSIAIVRQNQHCVLFVVDREQNELSYQACVSVALSTLSQGEQ